MPKILIADDSIAVRKVAERLLTEAGMGVTLAANGSEALALLGKERPDLVVSDVIMPDKSGYEVCAFVRSQANLADLPVLLISGIVNEEVSRQAESCKADGVLKKPFQGTSLKDRVLDLLMKRQHKDGAAPEPVTDSTHDEKTPGEEPADAALVVASEQPIQEFEHIQSGLSVNGAVLRGSTDSDAMAPVESGLEPVGIVEDQVPVGPDTLVEDDHRDADSLAQREARIAELEEQLVCERRQTHEQLQQMQNALEEHRAQIAGLSSRTEMLNQALEDERAQRTTLTEQFNEVSKDARRAEALETAVAEAHVRIEELLQQVSANDRNTSRVLELEAHLAAERGAAGELVRQITSLEHVEQRARELEATLAKQREQAEGYEKKIASCEGIATRVSDLEQSLEQERLRIAELNGVLATERETAVVVMAKVKELETVVQRAHELDLALAEERARSAQLMRRTTEAEHAADQSTRRFEDMARKLGEIAGLASQLGNGKR